MEIEILPMLSLFSLLSVASGTFFLAKRFKIPYTVLLVAIGTLLVPLSYIPFFSFIKEFSLTPSLLFYIFLPVLIFESAYNISARKIIENIRSISLLSIVSLLISTFFTGFAIHFGFKLFDFDVPLIVSMIFGALISATDPVAVLALFKEFGAPRRLSLIFEGESLLNDGTAVALFLVMLEIATKGFHGLSSVLEGIFIFTTMVAGGTLLGIFMGILFSKAIEWTRSNESVSITLMFVVSHLTFILTEVISANLVIGGQEIRLSAIISTLVAAMVVGNYGRTKISPHAEEFIEKFWSQAAFMVNSIVFLLIGLLFTTIHIRFTELVWPMIGAIIIVATGRALSIYPVLSALNVTKTEKYIPRSWQHLLAWGSLRGALAVTVVLLIPDNLQFAGWNHAFSAKEFIMALTIGCIYATLFLKATTIVALMRRLKIGELTNVEKEARADSLSLIHQKTLSKLAGMRERGFIDEPIYKKLLQKHETAFKRALQSRRALVRDLESDLVTRQVLEIHALGIEKQVLRTLFAYGEITEPVYKKILAKLTIQLEAAESGNINIDRALEKDERDIIDSIMGFVNKLFPKPSQETIIGEQYMYYRAQSIIARKALGKLEELIKNHMDIFNKKTAANVLYIYKEFKTSAVEKTESISVDNEAIISKLKESLARKGLFRTQTRELDLLKRHEMITPKVYIELQNQLEKEVI